MLRSSPRLFRETLSREKKKKMHSSPSVLWCYFTKELHTYFIIIFVIISTTTTIIITWSIHKLSQRGSNTVIFSPSFAEESPNLDSSWEDTKPEPKVKWFLCFLLSLKQSVLSSLSWVSGRAVVSNTYKVTQLWNVGLHHWLSTFLDGRNVFNVWWQRNALSSSYSWWGVHREVSTSLFHG